MWIKLNVQGAKAAKTDPVLAYEYFENLERYVRDLTKQRVNKVLGMARAATQLPSKEQAERYAKELLRNLPYRVGERTVRRNSGESCQFAVLRGVLTQCLCKVLLGKLPKEVVAAFDAHEEAMIEKRMGR